MYDEVSTTFQATVAEEKYLPVSFSGDADTDIYSGYSEDNSVTASGIIEERSSTSAVCLFRGMLRETLSQKIQNVIETLYRTIAVIPATVFPVTGPAREKA